MTTDLLRAEWTKLRSLRSTRWSLAAMAVLTLGMSVPATALTMADWDSMNPADRQRLADDPISLVLQPGASWGLLAISVLGVMVIAGEYSTGTIRATLLAVPRRTPVLVAKGAVFGLLVLVIAELMAFPAFFACRALLDRHLQISLGDPGVLRAVLGLGLYYAVMGLFAMAIGALIRHVAGAIACSIGFVTVISTLTTLLPGSLGEHVDAYMPGNAGRVILSSGNDPEELLSPWQGFGVMCVWTAALLAIAVFLLRRRDA